MQEREAAYTSVNCKKTRPRVHCFINLRLGTILAALLLTSRRNALVQQVLSVSRRANDSDGDRLVAPIDARMCARTAAHDAETAAPHAETKRRSRVRGTRPEDEPRRRRERGVAQRAAHGVRRRAVRERVGRERGHGRRGSYLRRAADGSRRFFG